MIKIAKLGAIPRARQRSTARQHRHVARPLAPHRYRVGRRDLRKNCGYIESLRHGVITKVKLSGFRSLANGCFGSISTKFSVRFRVGFDLNSGHIFASH